MHWGRAYFAVQSIAGAAWWIAVFASPFVRTVTLGSLDPIVVAALDIPLFVLASVLAALGMRWAAMVAASWTIVVALLLAVYATVTTEAGWGVLIMIAAAGASVIALALVLLGRVPTEWMVRGPFAFRAATDRARSRGYILSTTVQIVAFWGLFLVVFPLVLTFLEQRWEVGVVLPAWARLFGIAVLVLASALGLSSAFVMSTRGRGTPLPSAMANRLVITGPYRWVRNPMAVAGILQGVAVGLILSSWLVVAYAVIGSLLWNYAIRPSEEADLRARFGDGFARYARDVRCWLPRVPERVPRRAPIER